MPDDWLSIVRSFSQDFYHDSSRFRLAVGTAIPERQPVYAVCQLCSSEISLTTQDSLLGVLTDYVFDGGLSSSPFFSVPLCAERRHTQGMLTFSRDVWRCSRFL